MSTYVELITVCYKKPDTHCQNGVCVSSELIAVFYLSSTLLLR